ncbi:carbohydrate ABC transporter permease [Limnochorda pilosa]|uniref:Sugar ABC transporter permease n=1 Tax=Limnochorda pilosa TaxID=1555112 RepID=A0A0K2SN97_LIMPI|nr:carbohydrate ABC transporter permease [Limnochorda pilosa]BAS28294.1 sugar ABC transporter permease [Limnochorda pilosa]
MRALGEARVERHGWRALAPGTARSRAALVRALVYLGLAALAAVFLYPLVLMVFTAFKSTREIFMDPFGLPSGWSLKPFLDVWGRARFSVYFRNSVLVTSLSTVVVLACSSLSAYALARYRFRFNGMLYLFFLAGIMIPIRLGVLPLFLLMRDLHLLNTHASLVLTYAASGMPMSVFLLAGFFRTLPKELEYAARIDGCTEFQTFYRVMLPLVRPGLATVTIVNFVPWWNDFFFPLLFIQSDHLKTIPLGMTVFFGQYMTDWGLLFAGMLIASLPLLVVYLVMSRQFIAGLTAGAVKG